MHFLKIDLSPMTILPTWTRTPSPLKILPAQTFAFLVAWLMALIVAWCENRVLCEAAGIPTDCDDLDVYKAYVDCTWLINRGIVIAYVCQLQKVWHVTSSKDKAIWFLCYLAVGPTFSGFGEVPVLQSSLSSYAVRWDVPTIVYTCAFVGVLVLVVALIRRTWATHGAVYPVTRLSLIAGYVATLSVLGEMGHTVHVHHYEVGFIIACMAFDASKLSQFFLCVGCGIMVHGISVYEYKPVVVAHSTRNSTLCAAMFNGLLNNILVVTNSTTKYSD